MISFFEWLTIQQDRSDDVGDLAKNLAADPNAPTKSYGCLRQYLSGCDAEVRALDAAWAEYSRPKSLIDF